MSAGLSMGQLDTLKAYLLDQAARVDEAKVCSTPSRCLSRGLFFLGGGELLEVKHVFVDPGVKDKAQSCLPLRPPLIHTE